ncbi:MAG: terminase large subunit [Defluviitaleaceae bacterium]|nr:terminase large subunit [Defluviitaleaceae bacterium]
MQSNYIYDYHAKIQSGEIVAGKWIKSVYTMLVTGLENGDYFYSADRAEIVISFIENMCRHSKGRNDHLKLELWQKAMLAATFGIVDGDGLRVFREVFVVIGRKNGKTIVASAVIMVMAFLDGEYGAEIYCLAPKLDQANILFSENFYEMLKKEEELLEFIHKRRSDIYVSETNTIIKPIAFNYKKADGYNPSLTVNDELAQWPARTGLRQYGVMKSARGARKQPLMLSISTAGDVNDGIYDELFTRSTRFLEGGSKEKRLLPFIYMIDDIEKWNDLNELKKANPNMGVSVFEENFSEDIIAAENSFSEKAEFLMKHCNIKQNSSVAWLDYETIEKAGNAGEGLSLSDFEGCYAMGGIDLSQYTDLTAACVIIQRGGKIYNFTQFFMPAQKLEELQARDGVPYDIFVKKGILRLSGENKINYKDVLNWFVMLEKKYRLYIQMTGYDRNLAAYLVDDLNEAGFQTDDVHQGENLTPVIREFEGIIKDGDFIIVENNLLKAHMLNVALKQNVETRRVRPVKIEPRAKIDGFVAAICAMTVRQKHWYELGKYQTNED